MTKDGFAVLSAENQSLLTMIMRTGVSISSEILTQIHRNDRRLADELIARFRAPLPSFRPSEWCEKSLELRSTTIKAHFSFRGREYMRDIIDDIASDIHFQTRCMGTGTGKTTMNIGQLAFVMENEPSSMLYVVPAKEGQGGARELNNSCIIPTIKATECLRSKLPVGGQSRHQIGGLKCVFGGNILHLVGANSPGQLAGPRRRIVWLDESDKFKEKLGREASADYLANERTKQVPRSKLIRSSTPSLDDFGIWPHLMASDLRRRFVPCPHCSLFIVLVQSAQYTVLPLKLPDGSPILMAEMRWDNEAKRKDGSWDMDRVVRSARFECPDCGGHIRDEHREKMDAGGKWIPTRAGVIGHRGYHLPSFYAPHVDFESSWGGMAKKFLDAQESGAGMRGYINSELAEVDDSQEHGRLAVEINSENFARTDWTALMSCDFQKLWPYLWFVIAKWSSFKLQPPLAEGWQKHLDLHPEIKAKCQAVASDTAWKTLAEILRFDPQTGDFPLLDFLITQKITGAKLVKLHMETCGGNTLDLGRYLYREMKQPMPKGGDSEIIAAGHCELSGDDVWQELRDLQQQFHVGEILDFPNHGVLIDSGYMEKHNPEVLRKCYESNGDGPWKWYDPVTKAFTIRATHAHCRPAPVNCWTPYRGLPISTPGKFRGGDGIGRNYKISPDDPFKGTSDADKSAIEVLEAASEFYFHRWMDSRDRQEEIRAALKEQRAYKGNVWSIASNIELFPKTFTIEMFQAQLNAKGRNADGEIWERGSGGSGKRRHPDHLNDCCRNMYPLAEAYGFFDYEKKE